MSEAFRWVHVKSKEELKGFYQSVLPKIREAARSRGYAVGVHGSMIRDLDLIAIPWVEDASSKDELAKAIHKEACGLMKEKYQWETKPNGRTATCMPICWPEIGPEFELKPSLGHIDLSVVQSDAAFWREEFEKLQAVAASTGCHCGVIERVCDICKALAAHKERVREEG